MRTSAFTEMVVLEKSDFERLIAPHKDDEKLYKSMKKDIKKRNDYTQLGIT